MEDLEKKKLNNEKFEGKSVFEATTSSLQSLQDTFAHIQDILQNFKDGDSKVELRKRFLLKSIDEVWIRIVEDTIPAIDAIIRRPGFNLQDEEEIKAIELISKVTSRSVIHLAQHTDYINEIKDDGMVMPSKLLNVYQDENEGTYENKFINTLIYRLYSFVMLRYENSRELGVDEKNTLFTYDQKFEEGERKGKINISIEVSEPPEGETAFKNYIFSSDTWKRVERIVEVCRMFMSSPFVRAMGKNYVKPPIMRTNMLLKNVNFNQCLQLWEFLEQYENTGYDTMLKESLEDISEDFLKDFFNSVATQYVIFQNNISTDFNEEKTLDSRITDVIKPTLKEELDPVNEDEFEKTVKKCDKQMELPSEDEHFKQVEKAIIVALAADNDEELPEEEDNSIKYRYNYSFLARLIQAQNPTQEYYTAIKNKLLSYKKVKGNISWSQELFTLGRKKCAKLRMRGKTLCVFLPLNPNDYLDSKYKFVDMSNVKAHSATPFLMKIRNPRNLKYALELIEVIMAMYEAKPIENFEEKDYHMPYETIEQLLNREPPLIRLIGERTGDFDYNSEEDEELIEEGKEQPIEDDEKEEDETFERDGILYRYNYSFEARLILAGDPCQEFYTTIKNKLLSYKKVKGNISWEHELFRLGRAKVAKLKMRGKTLCIYLPLDPADYIDSKYRFIDVSDVKAHEGTPFLMKIKNPRNLKYALELIEIVMESLDAKLLNNYEDKDFHLPYETKDQLLGRGLIKLIENKAVVFDDNDDDKEEVTEEQVVASEEVTDQEDENEENEVFEKDGILYRYSYSFEARLILAQDPTQEYYTTIKNKLLSYKKVKSNISWEHELFRLGRVKVAKLKMRGKTLCIYLPLNPNDYVDSKYRFEDVSEVKSHEGTPFLMRIRNPRNLKYALELIETVMASLEAKVNVNYQEEDFHIDYETKEQLLGRGLIKLIENKGSMFGDDNNEKEEVVEEQVVASEEQVVASEEVTDQEDENEENEIFEKDGILYRYSYSFEARLILAQDPTQEYYTTIKNKLLSYKKVKSNISWEHELFRLGRVKVAKLKMRGKTLCIYLPLNPNDYVDSKYRFEDVSEVKSHEGTPFLMRIRNPRNLKYALELIETVMASLEAKLNANYQEEDFHIDYETKEQLLERGAVKLIETKGSLEDRLTEKQPQEVVTEDKKEVKEEIQSINKIAESVPQDEDEDDGDIEGDDDNEEGGEITSDNDGYISRNFSFEGKLIQSNKDLQQKYSTLKNLLLSYNLVKSSVSWKQDSFKRGRVIYARIKIRGKVLLVYLPIESDYFAGTKYNVKATTEKTNMEAGLLSVIKVRSDRSLKYAIELIESVMKYDGISQKPIENIDYTRDYMTTDELLALPEPLVKIKDKRINFD